jgi:hypothetical protein
VEAILQATDLSYPNVVADLSGVTGFISKELLRQALPGVQLMNVDNRISLFHSTKSLIGPLESRVKSNSIHQPFSTCSQQMVFPAAAGLGGPPAAWSGSPGHRGNTEESLIVCCLWGKHREQLDLDRRVELFGGARHIPLTKSGHLYLKRQQVIPAPIVHF